jgi:Ni/Co efflux regulator RcnB
MKRILSAAVALTMLSGTIASAQPVGPDRNGPPPNDQRYDDQRGPGPGPGPDQRGPGPDASRNNPGPRMAAPRWSRGDRLPQQYRGGSRYVVNDWRVRHLRKPPRGYHWVRDDGGNYFLVAITTGIILDLLLNSR